MTTDDELLDRVRRRVEEAGRAITQQKGYIVRMKGHSPCFKQTSIDFKATKTG
jgi:hypothetical protein